MRIIALFFVLLCFNQIHAQKWVDTIYKFNKFNVTYGSAVDFAGNNRSLTMDICVPTNDAPPQCGRPLLIAIHGGAFMAGSKDDYTIQQWMKDYAKRGYVTAAINYRLGMFQTSNSAHCNVTQLFNTPWDCSNMADTAEWYRGCYRGIQDAKGAIRYLIINNNQYKIDTRNIFLAGESAGGFIALGTAFLDTISEKTIHCGAITSVSAPNAIYENACVKQFNWDTSIASMRLERPDLGSIEGSLNSSAGKYIIKGVGNFFGGMFPKWLNNNTYATPPSIYMYHQPNDLIVPIKTDKVLIGYSNCFTNLGCANLINLPYISGSAGIRNQILSLKAQSQKVPNYWFDSTTNNADCLTQAGNPSLTGHSIDNYWLRSLHMAQYFAPLIDTTSTCNLFINEKLKFISSILIYPNPFLNEITIKAPEEIFQSIQMFDIAGKSISILIAGINTPELKIEFKHELEKGVYFIHLTNQNGVLVVRKMIKS